MGHFSQITIWFIQNQISSSMMQEMEAKLWKLYNKRLYIFVVCTITITLMNFGTNPDDWIFRSNVLLRISEKIMKISKQRDYSAH